MSKTTISKQFIQQACAGAQAAQINDNNDLLALDVDTFKCTTSPVFEPHKRGKNWMATVTRSPSAPGGLERRFWGRDRGNPAGYIVPSLAEGDVIEMAADYTAGSGRVYRKRVYARVIDVQDNRILGWVDSVPQIFTLEVGE